MENDRDTADTTRSAGAMYGDFRAAREAAEEVSAHGRGGKQGGSVILSTVRFAFSRWEVAREEYQKLPNMSNFSCSTL